MTSRMVDSSSLAAMVKKAVADFRVAVNNDPKLAAKIEREIVACAQAEGIDPVTAQAIATRFLKSEFFKHGDQNLNTK